MEIVEFIEGKRRVDAHESAMPRWGPILRRRPDGSISAGGSVPEIYAITDYLRSIQKAPRVDVRTIDLEPPSKPADPRALGDAGLR